MQVGENPLNRSGKPSYIKDEDIVSTLYESISSLNKAVICLANYYEDNRFKHPNY